MAVTVLVNASVLDAERGELGEGQSVVVENGRIADVGPGLSGPGDALVIDGNPLDDIRVLTTPDQTLKLIMKEGAIYKNEL